LVARNVKRLWWGLAESAFGVSIESGGRFCVGTFGSHLVSVAVKMFRFNLLRNFINFVLSMRFSKILLQ
jgi:hypothetical protein